MRATEANTTRRREGEEVPVSVGGGELEAGGVGQTRQVHVSKLLTLVVSVGVLSGIYLGLRVISIGVTYPAFSFISSVVR